MHLKKQFRKKRKSNKIWVDQGSAFYNNDFKDFLKIYKINKCIKCNKCIQHTMKENLLLQKYLLQF